MNESQRSEPRTIAVVESDPAVRFSLKFSLETEGLDVHLCAAAEELLDIVDTLRFHCLVVDYRLAGMNGLDLVDRLGDRNFRPPVILLASHPTAAIRQQAERRGIAIVEKPLMGNVLTDKIRELVA